MKSLLALLVLGLLLGVGFWKTQYPDATVEDLTESAGSGLDTLRTRVASLADGGAGQKAINDRIDTLENDLVETQRIASDTTVIDGRLKDAERRLDATDSKLASLGDSTAQLGTQLTSLGSKLDTSIQAATEQYSGSSQATEDITSAVDALDSKLELLNRRVDEQSQAFNASNIDSALASLNAKITALQEDQQRNTDTQAVTLSGMSEKLDAFEARLNTLSSDASQGQAEAVASINGQIDQRIALLEDKLGTTNSDSLRIESLSNELSASRVKMSALEQNASDTNKQLAELRRTIDELKTRNESSSIDTQQAQIRSQLSELQAKLSEANNENVTELTDALQATRQRIETLEQRVVDLPASSSEATDATEAQNALQAQIRALERKLSNIDTAPDPKLVNTLSAVEEKVSQLESKSFVTQEDLRAQQEAKSIEYKIYFDKNSTAITEDAGKVLNSFIAQEKNRTTGVSIFGFTDRRGSAAYNQRLALQRATNVRSYLIQNGFSYTKIKSISGLGEDAAAAVAQDGQEDAQQRAVVLYAEQP